MSWADDVNAAWDSVNWQTSRGGNPAKNTEPVKPLFGGAPLLHSPLPPNRAKYASDFMVPNYRHLTGDSTEEEIINAITDTEGCKTAVSESKQFHRDRSQEILKIIDGLKKALENARSFRSEADSAASALNRVEDVADRELEWLRGLYIEAITRKKERESLMEELEAYERIKKNAAWGERIFDYQYNGAVQMAKEMRCILGDEMGLGKTLQAIAASDLSAEGLYPSKKVLVVTQNDIVSNFAREVSKWSRGRNVIALGAIKNKDSRHFMLAALAEMQEFTVLANYEMWRRDPEIIKILKSLKFDTIIIDEAHNLKDDKSVNFKRLHEIVYAENDLYQCEHCGHRFIHWPSSSLCQECFKPIQNKFGGRCSIKRVYLMTGTSILNAPGDIWPLLNLLDNVAFPTKREYLKRYCELRSVESLTGSWVDRWFFKYGGEQLIQRKLGQKYIRRTRKMVGEDKIPPQDVQWHRISFEPGEYEKQRSVMRQIWKYNAMILNEMGDTIDVPTILAILTRTRQALTWPAGIIIRDENKDPIAKCEVEESIKVDYAENLLTDLTVEQGQKCVVFSKFQAPLEELAKRLQAKGINTALYIGGVKQDKLDEIATKMDAGYTAIEDCDIQVVLATYAKGSTGLNFTNATQTVLLDREWNPSKEDQSEGRTARIGQKERTTVHIIHVEGTIDDGFEKLIDDKAAMIGGFDKVVEGERDAESFSIVEYLKRKFNES